MKVQKSKYIVLGAGIGMIVGWVVSEAAIGLVLGAAAGLVFERFRPDTPSGNSDRN